MERLYRRFTYSEIAALALPERSAKTMRGIEGFDRADIAKGLEAVTRATDWTSYYRYAWKDQAQGLENTLQPERARSRSRSRGMGMGY